MSGKSLGQVAYEACGLTTHINWDSTSYGAQGLWERAAAAVVAAHEASRWRKVEDGLPGEGTHVLVLFADGCMTVAHNIGGEMYDPLDDASAVAEGTYFLNVTHWAALPAPPEGRTR